MSYTQHKNNNSAAANKAINKLSKQSKGTLGTRLAGEQFATNKKGKLKQTVAPKPVLTTSSKLHPSSLNNANFKRVKQILVKWVNSLIAKRKLQITDVTNDMADGLMFACILEELTGEHIVEWQTTTSEKGKGMNFARVVHYLHASLNIPEDPDSWTRVGVHTRDQYSALALLVHISHAVGANLNLPSNLSIAVMKSSPVDGVMKNKTSVHKITLDENEFVIDSATLTPASEIGRTSQVTEADAFDELCDSPEKQDQIVDLMTAFINERLEVTEHEIIGDLAAEMEDGVKLLLLVGTVGNFYIPMDLGNISQTPIQKLERIKLALAYMREGLDIETSGLKASDFVGRKNIRGILRCLYALFEKDSE